MVWECMLVASLMTFFVRSGEGITAKDREVLE